MLQIRTDLRTNEERIEAVILNLAFIMPATMDRLTSPSGIAEMRGSILSGSPVIGYVVIGIVAFMLGAAVTLLCFRTKDLRGPSPDMPPEIRRNKFDK